MSAPFAIAIAPTGARRTHADHAALPLTPDEIARTAAECADAGATLIHLHVRDAHGHHCLDVDVYRTVMARVRQEAGDRIIIQATTEAVGRYAPPQQMALVQELRPPAVSIALKEIAPPGEAEAAGLAFYQWLATSGIGVQHILYSQDEQARFLDLHRRGLLPFEQPHALFVLGRYAVDQCSQPAELLPFLPQWPADWPWSLCAFGPLEARCMTAAAALGGHARVGFENNLHRPDGRAAERNADLVSAVASLTPATGRPVASLADARAIYGVQ